MAVDLVVAEVVLVVEAAPILVHKQVEVLLILNELIVIVIFVHFDSFVLYGSHKLFYMSDVLTET